MHWWKKKKTGEQGTVNPSRLSLAFDGLNRRWADFMTDVVSGWSVKKQRATLAAFALLVATYCGHLIYTGFQNNIHPTPRTPLALPRSPSKITGRQQTEPLASQAGKERIMAIRRYLDSLGRSPTGSRISDSLFHARPGLLDSLETAEKLYRITSKNVLP